MRYTKKGQQKLVDYLYAYGAYVAGLRANEPAPLRFEPGDFKGVVVLTSKEAEVVNRALAFGLAVSESLRDQDDFEDLAEKIDKRIEQAEKENADN